MSNRIGQIWELYLPREGIMRHYEIVDQAIKNNNVWWKMCNLQTKNICGIKEEWLDSPVWTLVNQPETTPSDPQVDCSDHLLGRPQTDVNEDDMCPNCVTPWKCNGPHIEKVTEPTPQASDGVEPATDERPEVVPADDDDLAVVEGMNVPVRYQSDWNNWFVACLIARVRQDEREILGKYKIIDALIADRDEAVARAELAEAEIARMRPLFDAAYEWAAEQVDLIDGRRKGAIGAGKVLDAYRAASTAYAPCARTLR
jgi:hypothetical protein